ncbi:response regulator transcription factor [Dyella sp. A6]|uniref:response regulator transcription factor n=1 Tax=Dyella aluminiiresistens TaxID=3069105 RepID=UPI002E78553A|nr:response regulator transcription factor [Dyella sp. A6]
MSTIESSIRLLIADDHPMLREGIAAVIEGQSDMKLVAEAGDGYEAIEKYRAHRPDVVLMDLQMPRMNGVEAIVAIRREFADARILVLTTYRGDAQALRALKAGAQGYLLKSTLRKDLIETIRQLHAGKRCIPPEVAIEIAGHTLDDALTAREVAVLGCIAGGNSNRAAAVQLGISEETVKAHMKSILAKLEAKDRTHAVTIAMKRGIFGP